MSPPGSPRASLPGTRPVGTHDESAASREVRQMFSRIAPRYDLLNHLLSLRFDVMWRKRLAQRFAHILRQPEARVLDVCCGTGDLALALVDAPTDSTASAPTLLVGADFAHPMLVRAREKAISGLRRRLEFAEADALSLPFANANSLKAGAQYILYFSNPTGVFIMEDSWIYGSPDDATRFYGGTYNIMRNTMEKCGSTGGDGFNAKGSSTGNMAYNLIIGGATNGTKTASDGTTAGECQFTMYNNTYINDGFRNTGVFGARSGSVEIENNSRALVFVLYNPQKRSISSKRLRPG